MLMLIIGNTAARNAVVGARPMQFAQPRQALEAVKGQLKMHVATIHAETVHVDDNIPLVIGFVGRGNAAETALANVLTAQGDNAAITLERCGVIAAYHVEETDDVEALSARAQYVVDQLATYLPSPEGALGGDQVLLVDDAELLVGSPLNVVVSYDGSLLGLSEVSADSEEHPDHGDNPDYVAVAAAPSAAPVVEMAPAAETQVEIEPKETVMSKMSNYELMSNVRKLHSELCAVVPNFKALEVAFPDAARLRTYITLGVSQLPEAVLNEISERAEDVVAKLKELAALSASQDEEIAPLAAVSLDSGKGNVGTAGALGSNEIEEFEPVAEDEFPGDEDEFEEVDTRVEGDPVVEVSRDALAAAMTAVGTDGDGEYEEEDDNIDLSDDAVLAEKLPAIWLLGQGRLDAVDGLADVMAKFSNNFIVEQGSDFNEFNSDDIDEALASGDLLNLWALLTDADWLALASFESLYELDGALTDLAAAAGVDVFGEVEESGITELDADESEEEAEVDEDDEAAMWTGADDEDEDDHEADTEDASDLSLMQVTILPRLVLNVVADYNGHAYTADQLRALAKLPCESGRVLNLGHGVSAKDSSSGAQGAYLRPISRIAKALGQLAGATVLLPENFAKLDADTLAAKIAGASLGVDINELLSDVLTDLHGIDVDEDGNIMIGFSEDEDGEDSVIALNDLCSFDINYSMMREHDFGPATIEVTAVLSMRLPSLGYVKRPQAIVERVAALAARNQQRSGIDVYPAITFNAADRMFDRAEGFEDRNVSCLSDVVDALVGEVNMEESPWAGAVFASHRGVTETGMFGLGLLALDGDGAAQYLPMSEIVDIDVYASVANDAAAVFTSPIGNALFSMGGDSTVMLTTAKEEEEEEGDSDDMELDSSEE